MGTLIDQSLKKERSIPTDMGVNFRGGITLVELLSLLGSLLVTIVLIIL